MTKKIILLWLIFLFSFSIPSFSQPPGPPSEKERDKITERDEIEREKIEKNLREIEDRMLQELKSADPVAYQERIKRKELAEKIKKIVSSFRQGSVAEGEARRQLAPLVRKSLEPRFKNLDKEVEAASRKVEYLKKIKKDPDALVAQQIDHYLGKGSPEDQFYP